MSMVTQGSIADLYFGFDTERLLLRLDARGGPLREQLADVEAIRVVFLQPAGFELLVLHPGPQAAAGAIVAARLGDGRGRTPRRRPIRSSSWPSPSAAWAERPTSRSTFTSNCSRSSNRWSASRTKAPSKPTVPSPDYELIMWQA